MPNFKYAGIKEYSHTLVDNNRDVHKGKLIDDVQDKFKCSRNHAMKSVRDARNQLGLVNVSHKPKAYLRRCRECNAIFKGRTKTAKKCYDCCSPYYKRYTKKVEHEVVTVIKNV